MSKARLWAIGVIKFSTKTRWSYVAAAWATGHLW